MLNENEKVKGKYKAIDPYIKQSPLEDFSIPNYRQYDETTQEEQEREFQYKIYDYPQYDVEKLRDKRQIDQPRDEEIVYEKFLTPLYVITAFFAAMLIFGPLLVRKGPNRGIVQASIMLSAFCMWIFWFTIYFGQMNPLMGPRLENTTVAWIAYKLGNPFKNTSL